MDTLAVRELPAGMRCPGRARGDPAVSTAPHDQFGTARIRERKGAFLPGEHHAFTGPNLIIFSIICAFGAFLSSGTRLRPVDADAVGDDRRAVGAAVDAHLEGVAQP